MQKRSLKSVKIQKKKRRQETERTSKMLEFEHLADEDETDDDGLKQLVPLNEFETEKFVLWTLIS